MAEICEICMKPINHWEGYGDFCSEECYDEYSAREGEIITVSEYDEMQESVKLRYEELMLNIINQYPELKGAKFNHSYRYWDVFFDF